MIMSHLGSNLITNSNLEVFVEKGGPWVSFQRILTPNLNSLSRTEIGRDTDGAPKKSLRSRFLEPKSEPLSLGEVGGGCWAPGLRGPDDAWCFAVCMFCIFPGPAALAAGRAGKKACCAVCSTCLDSEEWRLAPQPSSSPPLCPRGQWQL